MDQLNLNQPRLNIPLEEKYLKLSAKINLKVTRNVDNNFKTEEDKDKNSTENEENLVPNIIDPFFSKLLNSDVFHDAIQGSSEHLLNTVRLT